MGEIRAPSTSSARPGSTTRRDDLPGRAALEASLGIELRPPVVIVTVHPATLDPDPAAADASPPWTPCRRRGDHAGRT
ncbi:MAG: hypothetical protein U0838_03580 [Chloroflexota bacterium]